MYKASIENILNYNKSTKEIQLSMIESKPDTANLNSTKPGEGNLTFRSKFWTYSSQQSFWR